MGVFSLSMDLGRSYHESVLSINGPGSFLSWECLFLSMEVVLIMGVFFPSMDLGRSYHGSVLPINGPRSFLSWECFSVK